MKIKKIYIKNFKGIKEKRVIEFNEQTSLLIGPNGFGKTTIFDILELCLTGKIYRTEQKSHVTKHTKDYKKQFYQNDIHEDVIIKAWLENSAGEELIITKFLDKEHKGSVVKSGRKNKPQDFGLLETYKDSAETFYEETFDSKKLQRLSQEEIENFFNFSTDSFRLDEIYKLFNYIQQEETTFFLKKSETDRKNSLGFLFQTTQQEEKFNKITKIISRLTQIDHKLEKKTNDLTHYQKYQIVPFSKIFVEKEFEFDQENIFEKDDYDFLKTKQEYYLKFIEDLIDFRKTFSPIENEKKNNLRYVEQKLKDNFLDFCSLAHFLEEKEFIKLKRSFSVIKNFSLHRLVILQIFLKKSELYQNQNEKYERYSAYLDKLNKLSFDDSTNDFNIIFQELLPNEIAVFEILLNEYKALKTTMRTVDLSTKQIINYREKIHKELHKREDELPAEQCPYCGYQWESATRLELEFREHEEELEKLIEQGSKRIIEIENEIKERFTIPAQTKIETYLSKSFLIDKAIIDELISLQEESISFSKIEILTKKFGLEDLIIKDLKGKTISDIDILSKKVLEILKKELNVTENIYKKIERFRNISFDNEISFVEKKLSDLNLKEYRLVPTSGNLITENKLSENRKKILKNLDKQVENFVYDNEKASDKNGYYNKYFNHQSDAFYSLSLEKLEEKKEYITYMYQIKKESILSIYTNRRDKIKQSLIILQNIKDFYKEAITSHKREMAENIKLPFFLYTARILQNYQQGFGVFLSTDPKNDSIRFLTDPSTNHDAMHHLSSGQLAVISLAFTLAINKTYNLSRNLKFLIIDDPIQDMDSMNVHSFIELIRHEFINDYQILISTHNDSSAMYMKYKFERKDNNPVNVIHVQREFFGL